MGFNNRGTPIKKGTLFFSRIYALFEFSAAFLDYPLELHRITKLGVVGFVAPGCGIFDSSPVFNSRPGIAAGYVALVTAQINSTYLSFFQVGDC